MIAPPLTLDALHALIQSHLADNPGAPLIVPGLSESIYRAYPAVNFSNLKNLDESPKKYRWMLEHPKKRTKAMAFGTIVHGLTLTPEEVPGLWVKKPFKDFKTKEAQQWRDAQELIILDDKDLEEMTACAESIKQHPFAAWILAGGKNSGKKDKPSPKEVGVFRRHEPTGLLIKARIDAPFVDLDDRICAADIKKVTTVREWKVMNSVRDYYYDLQAAVYTWALGATGSFYIIAAEGTGPYDVDVFDLADWIDGGRTLMEQLLERLTLCEKTKQWPGVSDTRQTVKVLKRPAYITREAADLEA